MTSPRRAIRRRLAEALDPDAQGRAYRGALRDVRVLALDINNPCHDRVRDWIDARLPAMPTDKASQLASCPECQLDFAGPTYKEKP